jgi:hypothetical protein
MLALQKTEGIRAMFTKVLVRQENLTWGFSPGSGGLLAANWLTERPTNSPDSPHPKKNDSYLTVN